MPRRDGASNAMKGEKIKEKMKISIERKRLHEKRRGQTAPTN
jgi:hypothetical protein